MNNHRDLPVAVDLNRPFMDLLSECVEKAPVHAPALCDSTGAPECAYGRAFDALGFLLQPGATGSLVGFDASYDPDVADSIEISDIDQSLNGASTSSSAFDLYEADERWKDETCGDVIRYLSNLGCLRVQDYIRGEGEPTV